MYLPTHESLLDLASALIIVELLGNESLTRGLLAT